MAIKQEIEQGKKAPFNILHNKDNNQLILEIIEKHILQATMWYVDSSAIKRAETYFTDGVLEWLLFFFLASVSQTMLLCAKSCMNVFLSPWVIRGLKSREQTLLKRGLVTAVSSNSKSCTCWKQLTFRIWIFGKLTNFAPKSISTGSKT